MTTTPDAHGQIDVPATPETVYALVSNPIRMAELAAENTRNTWLGNNATAKPGAKFKGANRHGNRTWSTTATITDADQATKFAFDVNVLGLPIARWQYDLSPLPDGGTRVVESTWDRRNPLLRKAGGLLTGQGDRSGANVRNIETTLRNIKQALAAKIGNSGS
jgi:hypothetical protein